MRAALLAGILYFAIVFVVGFLLGALRAFVLTPLLGETFGVILELPVILVICWLVSRNLIDRFCMRRTPRHAMVMGGVAFLLLLGAEAAFSELIGRTLIEHLLLYTAAPGALGLVGQITFALFPAIQVELARSRRR